MSDIITPLAIGTTWNPADLTLCTLTGSNLIATTSGTGGGVRGIASLASGKYYWECTYTTINTNNILVGIALASASLGTPATGTAYIGRSAGTIFSNGINSGIALGIINTAAVICIAVDFTGQLIWFRNGAAGNWNNNSSNNPATGTGGISISAASTGPLFPLMAGGTSDRITANFGDSAFTGAVPAGFTAGFLIAAATTAQARVMVMA